MTCSKAVHLLLINLILLQCQHLAQTYTQVATSGSSMGGEGPKIFKAINFDLIYPKSFNSSENLITTTAESIPSSSGADVNVNVDQQYNSLPQSNEQTNKAEADNQQPLYVTPPSNEAASYDNNRQQNSDSNINAQVVMPNRINIQQQQQQQQPPQRLRQNDNDNAAKEPQQQQDLATGRAVDYHTAYPFGQLITPLIKSAPRPVYNKPAAYTSSTSNVGKIVYPQAVYQQKLPSQAETDKLRGKGPIKDRFAPSQGVAAYQIKSNHQHHNHAPSYTAAGKIPSASNVVNSYVPPANLYSFPPNNVNYPSQTQSNKVALPSGIINSYAPPPSGGLKNSNYNLATASSHDNSYQYPGPLSTTYGASPNPDSGSNDAKDTDDGGGDGDIDNDNSVGVLPASAMDGNNYNKPADTNDDMSDNSDTGGPMDSQDVMSHDHHHDDHSYDTGKEYPTPPPGWLEDHPQHDHHPVSANTDFDHEHDHHHHSSDIEFDHDSHSHHFSNHDSYPSFPVYHHSYPEHIYDDHHDHHVEHVEPPPATTEAPLPEPPPEPRVKKYSYFYIGRKLWYIPLYFTVWFSFYVLWLIVKSIARHKVNLPNHYVTRRSVANYDLSKQQKENINQLTVSVMNKIENFRRKYFN